MPILMSEMATQLRSPTPSRFRRRHANTSVEALQARIDELALERQDLRARCAGEAALERNRIKLVRAQWELSHALIARHHPAA
jgi:translation initiation factor 1 (eIF-1/SUI1)